MNNIIKYVYRQVKGQAKTLDAIEDECIHVASVVNSIGVLDGYGFVAAPSRTDMNKAYLRFIMKYRKDI